MTTANLIPYLMAFEETPTFIVTSSIQALLIARGMPDTIIPSVEQKSYTEWEKTLALLTAEEQKIISDIVDLLRDPEALRQITSTSTTKEIVYLLNKEEVKGETTPEGKTAKIKELLKDPEVVKELSKISDTTDTKKLVETIDKEAEYSKGIVKLNTILFSTPAKAKTLSEIQAEQTAQIQAYNKQLNEQYQKRLKEIEELGKEETPAKTSRPIEKIKPTIKQDLKITRIDYPKWWKDSLNATIDFTAPGGRNLATISGKLRLFVATIVLTVTAETEIRFTFGDSGTSGPIYLGAEGQPKGFVAAMGNSPAPCGRGGLSITATDPQLASPKIGGWVTCFVEEVFEGK